MESIVLILIIIIGVISYNALKNYDYFQKYLFHVDKILVHKEYYRIVSSGFVHVNWLHLGVNMLVLSSFGAALMNMSGIPNFLIIYFASLIGGSLLALYFHRNHGDYSAVGASGAISGVVFACILIDPNSQISPLFLEELSVNAWIFGILYVLFSLYGIKTDFGQIGHEAHLGGAITGLFVMSAIQPVLWLTNFWVILILAIPAAIFLYLSHSRPEFMLTNFFKKKSPLKISKSTHIGTVDNIDEMDRILDKIGKDGMGSLSKNELAFLKEMSEK